MPDPIVTCFVYRCRRCGDRSRTHRTRPVPLARAQQIVAAVAQGQTVPEDVALYEMHDCQDGGGGLVDLLGYDPIS